jgi:hypothetical protein
VGGRRKTSRIKNQESRIKNQESRIKNQESRIKNQESRIKNQEKMRALSWVAGVDAKSSCQGGKMTVSAKRGDAECAEESAEVLWICER